MNKIFFYPDDRPVDLEKRMLVKRQITGIFLREKTGLHRVNYIFSSDENLLSLNRKYLKHNFYTDVISFTLSGKDEPVFGEVYLSTDRIKNNAKNYNESYQKELLRVLIHGALHLCGFDDNTQARKKLMRQKEDFYLKSFSKGFT
jgi:rRNA maturation RNase YbeY